jgi:hypothetical protein
VPRGLFPMRLTKLRMGINYDPELGLEHGDSGWKYLDEEKRMKTLDRGSKTFEESEILMPHSLKIHLRGWVCYKVVSEHGNNTWPSWAHARVV